MMNDEHNRRWRLLLGTAPEGTEGTPPRQDAAMDAILAVSYDNQSGDGQKRHVGFGASAPRVAWWFGDTRIYFLSRVVQVIQADAIDRLGLKQLLLEPEMLETVEANVHLVATLVNLGRVMPQKARASVREVVARVVEQVKEKLADKVQQAVRGALNRVTRTNRPRLNDINWSRTIAVNLGNYLPEPNTVVPERLVGYGRKQTGLQWEIVLVVDQPGSTVTSVAYASIFAAMLASTKAVKTRLVVYDTSVVGFTDQLSGPVDVIFDTQFGGGTDISKALAHCEHLVQRPRETVMVLISDFYDFNPEQTLRQMDQLQRQGVTTVTLLALDDDGTPGYNHDVASSLAVMGAPLFACTPDALPEMIALAINRGDLTGRALTEKTAKVQRRLGTRVVDPGQTGTHDTDVGIRSSPRRRCGPP